MEKSRWNKVLLSILFLLSCVHSKQQLKSRYINVFHVFEEFNTYCPERILWEAVAKLRCPNNSISYHCLQLSKDDGYRDTCKEQKLTTPGFYRILDSVSGNLDSKRCPLDRYQPRPRFSNDGNRCVYEKSVCSEEGQVVHTNGSTTADRTCRCDYNKGYKFVSSPIDNCHCTSSQEDCSCYQQICNNTSKIDQDYTCLENDSILSNITYNCPVIQSVFDQGNFEKDKDFDFNIIEMHDNIPKLDSKNRKNAICAILFFVLVYIVIMVLFYLGNTYNKYKGHLKIEINKEVYTEHIGSFITLMVEYVENKSLVARFLFGCPDVGEIRWQKNGNVIDLSKERDKYGIGSDSKPDLNIKNLKVDDEAKYRCCIKNKAGKEFCSEPIQLSVLGSVATLKHIPIEIRRLGRAAIDMYKKALKAEVCKEKFIVLIIIGAKSSGKTALWHNLLDKRTGQEGETNNILNEFYLTVKNEQWKVIDYSVRKLDDLIQLKVNPENKESKEETDETIELIILDIPGGKEYYAAFEPFLSRHAIYLLLSDVNEELLVVKRSGTKSNPRLESKPRIQLKKNGELIRDWLNSVHSKRLTATEDPSSRLTLTPSIVLVGTHIDKYSGTADKSVERDVLNCVDQKKKTISKHVSHSFVLSNTNTNISELQSLKEAIIDASDKIPWEEIPVRYKMFEKILDDERNTTVTLSFDEIHQLGKESGYPVLDKREIEQFLSYQHDVSNVIYHQDIPECVIISPNWLYSVIRKLLTAFHKEDENSSYKKKGLISLDLLNRIIGDTERNTNQTKQDIISILRTFDIVAIVLREYKETATYYYYVPSVIPEEHTVNLVNWFESERRGKTSFLCFSFDFLPPSLVHHVMGKLSSQYSICEQNGIIALCYRNLLVNYDRCAKQKLYFLSNKDELLFQIWYYGVQKISLCFQGLRKIIESTVRNYKSRHKLNIAFTYKLRCPDSKHAATDGWDILDTSRQHLFYCFDHKTNHEDAYTTWFTDSNQTVEHSEGVKRNLEPQFKRESSQRASVFGMPAIILDSRAYKVQKGETLKLECQIETRKSMPVINVIWWRKVEIKDVKVPVENTMKYRDGTKTIPSLTILDVKDDDIGFYWCEAINSNGTSISKTVEVNVEAENTEITDTKNVEIHKPFSDEENAYSQREIKKGVLDAVILNAEKDQEMAVKFINHLKEFIPDIDVELLKEFVKPGVTRLQSTNELFKSARFVLILVTENFKLSMLDRFIGEKVLLESLNDSEKLFRVIPVSVDGPLYMPFELAPLIAIQYYLFQIAKKERKDDSIYIKTLKRLFLHGRENYLTKP